MSDIRHRDCSQSNQRVAHGRAGGEGSSCMSRKILSVCVLLSLEVEKAPSNEECYGSWETLVVRLVGRVGTEGIVG